MSRFTELCLLAILSLSLIVETPAQSEQSFDLSFDIHKVFSPISITRDELVAAKTLVDLNMYFEPEWVREYKKVELFTHHGDLTKKSVGQDNNLTEEQLENLLTADFGSEFNVVVHYIPENMLSFNDVKQFDFMFTVEPATQASYAAGDNAMIEYIKREAIDKISATVFRQHHLSAVKFTVNELGNIIDAHIAESSGDETTDNILLSTVCDMPDWIPSSYANGTKTKQDFVLTAGDMNSCVVNLLNIRRLP